MRHHVFSSPMLIFTILEGYRQAEPFLGDVAQSPWCGLRLILDQGIAIDDNLTDVSPGQWMKNWTPQSQESFWENWYLAQQMKVQTHRHHQVRLWTSFREGITDSHELENNSTNHWWQVLSEQWLEHHIEIMSQAERLGFAIHIEGQQKWSSDLERSIHFVLRSAHAKQWVTPVHDAVIGCVAEWLKRGKPMHPSDSSDMKEWKRVSWEGLTKGPMGELNWMMLVVACVLVEKGLIIDKQVL